MLNAVTMSLRETNVPRSGTASAVIPALVQPIIPAPQLSVVISSYNRGELLADALRSVLAQQSAPTPPFELIVVDNNSTDNTRDVIQRFAAIDPRVRSTSTPKPMSSAGACCRSGPPSLLNG